MLWRLLTIATLGLLACDSMDIRNDATQICQDVRYCGEYQGASFSTWDECADTVTDAVGAGDLDRGELSSAEALEECAKCWLRSTCDHYACDEQCAGIVVSGDGWNSFVWEL